MIESPQVWLTEEAYARLKEELSTLLRRRSGQAVAPEASVGAGPERNAPDEQVLVDDRDRLQRIRKLQEMLRDPVIGQKPPDDGIAEPGMVITVRYAGEGDVETFLLAEREQAADADIEICSPTSPLGRALSGAAEGEQREFTLQDGRPMSVTLVRATPFTAELWQHT